MHIRRFAGLIVLVLLAGTPAAADEKGKPYKLPADPKAAVITMEFKGGMILRKGNDPALTVLADGTVIVGDAWGTEPRVEGKVTGEELQALLQYILDDQQFAQIRPDDLKMKGNVRVGDGLATTILINADGKTVTTSGYAVDAVASEAGPHSPAARYVAVLSRLNHFRYMMILGGEEGLKKEIALANAELKKQQPAEPGFEPGDLHIAFARRRERRRRFRRR